MPKPKLAKLVIKKKEPEPKAAKKTVAPVKQTAPRSTPVHRFVEQLRDKDGVHYRTTAEVATEVGVSVGWIHKIQRSPVLDVPSKVTRLGNLKVYLYTPEDVEAIKAHLINQQQVYNNDPSDRVQSWEEVTKKRERTTEDDADLQVDGDDATGDQGTDGTESSGQGRGRGSSRGRKPRAAASG
jgi:hypothetical protein